MVLACRSVPKSSASMMPRKMLLISTGCVLHMLRIWNFMAWSKPGTMLSSSKRVTGLTIISPMPQSCDNHFGNLRP